VVAVVLEAEGLVEADFAAGVFAEVQQVFGWEVQDLQEHRLEELEQLE